MKSFKVGEIPKRSDVRIKESKGSRQVAGLGTGWGRLRLTKIGYVRMHAKSLQSCLTLCDPMDCSLPDSSVHGILQGKNTGVGCHALLQGIFTTQGLNPGLPHYRWILYHLNHRKPMNTSVNLKPVQD